MTIEINQLAIHFGAKELFTIEQLIIPTGSRVGIVGDNGTGKSTLLNLIAGTVLPDQGQILLTDEVSFIHQLADEQTTDSGGEQTKKRIRAALRTPKGILLADEPTNHLDRKGIQFLEKQIKRYPGTVLVISHNRVFLDNVVDKILAIEDQKVTLYEGNYSAYLAQRAIQQKEADRAFESYQKERKRLEQARREVAEKSRQTRKAPRRMGNSEARLHRMGDQRAKQNLDNQEKGLATRLEKMTVVEKSRKKKPLVIPFAVAQKIHRQQLITAEHYSLSVGKRQLLKDTSFQLLNGSKTVLLGDNGSGKTTLFKQLLARDAALDFAQGIAFGYFSQTFEQLQLDKSIYQNVSEDSPYSAQEVRDLLAHMHFRGDSIDQKVGTLSGGERNKVAISQLLLSKNNVLLLDEPTNHLDIASIEVLEEALNAYQGTILFTTHDPAFVEAVATERWEIQGQKVVNLARQQAAKVENTAENQAHLVLENRKTQLISALSFATDEEKPALEQQFQEVIQQLKELAK